MKASTTIILAALIAVIAAFATVKMTLTNSSTSTESKKENAYEHIVRTGELNCGMIVFPPFIDKDLKTGELKGFNVGAVKQIAKLLDLKIKFTEIQLGYQKQDLESGKVDAICADGPWITSTIKYVSYTNPYSLLPAYVYKAANNAKITDLSSLDKPDVNFVGIDGDISIDLAKTFFPQAKIQSLSNLTDPAQLLLNLTTKKADVALTDVLNGDGFSRANPGMITRVSDKPVALLKVGFTIGKSETQLLDTLNNAIEVANNLGIIDKELNDYPLERGAFLPVKTYYVAK